MKSIFISFLAAALVSTASAATYTLGASQTGMGYSFLSGMAVGPMFPTMIAPANTGTSNHHMTAFLQYDLSGLAGVSSSDITDRHRAALPDEQCRCGLRCESHA